MKKALALLALLSCVVFAQDAIIKIEGGAVTGSTAVDTQTAPAPPAGVPVMDMRAGRFYITNVFPEKDGFSTGRSVEVDEPIAEGGSSLPSRWPGEPLGWTGHNGGAMRIFSQFSHFAYDDPIVYPGLKNKSHCHIFFGNTETSGVSTAVSIRTTGNSTSQGGTFNRSAYWVPCMVYVCDTADKIAGIGTTGGAACNPARNGEIIIPAVGRPNSSVTTNDGLNVYYKGYFGIGAGPENFSTGLPSIPTTMYHSNRNSVVMPPGFRMIAGNPLGTPSAPSGHTNFTCRYQDSGDEAREPTFDHIPGTGVGSYATAMCPSGTGGGAAAPTYSLIQVVSFPACWDGTSLDAPDHISHLRYPLNDHGEDLYCPTGFENIIPGVEYKLHYHYIYGESQFWRLASDTYSTDMAAGYSNHGDWFNGWDPTIMQLWVTNCINRGVDCHNGIMGPYTPPDERPGFITGRLWRLLSFPIGHARVN